MMRMHGELCSRYLTVVAFLLLATPDASAAANLLLPGICELTSGNKLSAVRSGDCPLGGKRTRLAGANIFDTLWVGSSGMNTCCNRSGGPATYPDALAALESASASGIRVFRFFASLFGDANKLWVNNPTLYWSEFDRAMDDFERLGLYSIPSIGTGFWHQVANAVTPGLNESANDAVINTSSVAFALQAKYFGELVTRYKDRNGVRTPPPPPRRQCCLLWVYSGDPGINCRPKEGRGKLTQWY